MNVDTILGLYNYWIVIFLMMTGFYMVIARRNLVKSIMGLNIFQSSVFLLYITMGKVRGGVAPIIADSSAHAPAHAGAATTDAAAANANNAATLASDAATHASDAAAHASDAAAHASDAATHAAHAAEPIVYSHPLPSVLMLTAIVVGIATTALALALIVRIREEYGTVDEERILELDRLP